MSIVIPVRHDTEALCRLLAQLPPHPDVQVIVSATDHGGEDLSALEAARPDLVWVHGPAGRGRQQNSGAARAVGRWLWFVHADSTLPPHFADTFYGVEAAPLVVGGAFRFALDSTTWQARLWERGVALRVRLFGLPYGDQGLFVRRDVFQRMGGFAPLPLMEDVEFVGRLKRQGPIVHLTEQVRTSARRWERDGWWKRSLRNLGLLALYYGGMPPERLARRYEKNSR